MKALSVGKTVQDQTAAEFKGFIHAKQQ